jgi:hypothetical protein
LLWPVVSGFHEVDGEGLPFTATHVDRPAGDELPRVMISGSGPSPGSTRPPPVSLSSVIMWLMDSEFGTDSGRLVMVGTSTSPSSYSCDGVGFGLKDVAHLLAVE